MLSARLGSLAAQRLQSTTASNLLEAGTSHLSSPVWTVGVRRVQSNRLLSTRPSSVSLERWQRNVSRLYARHLVEVAVAMAATRQFITKMEQAYEKPVDWVNWERREWQDELLASLGASKLGRAWAALKRVTELSLLALPLAVLYPFTYISPKAVDWSWSYALWGIEEAGPTFLKLTQWATTRQDLFSPEFCQYFGKLRDQTEGHGWEATKEILEQDLGDLANYLHLNPKPIGSGCIAQVYHGRLTKSHGTYEKGTEVAVKVQHPGIWSKVCVDFYILAKLAKFLEDLPLLNLRFLSISDTVRQFRDIMLPQLDLTLEAKHLRRFNRDFAGDDRVEFPSPLGELTTTRVLTETFVHGRPIMEYTKRDELVRKDLANLGLNTTLKMIFINDFLVSKRWRQDLCARCGVSPLVQQHGDLHPGNILVSEKDGKRKLHLLDCGLVVEMGPEQHVNLVKILGAFTRHKGRLAGQLMVDTSSKVQAGPEDVDMFVSGIEKICLDDLDNNFIEKVGDYIADICFLACRHKVKLEASFINAALAVEIMEGIATALNPNLVVTKVAMPMVIQAEMMHRLPKFSLW